MYAKKREVQYREPNVHKGRIDSQEGRKREGLIFPVLSLCSLEFKVPSLT